MLYPLQSKNFKIPWHDIPSPGQDFNYPEYMALAVWAQEQPEGLCIEIGTHNGKSAMLLANFFNPVLCIDTWSCSGKEYHMPGLRIGSDRSWNVFTSLISARQLEGVVIPICSIPEFLYDLPCLGAELFFVDGSHLYEDCSRDLELAALHLSKTGVIVVHDYKRDNTHPEWIPPDGIDRSFGDKDPWEGVTKAVDAFITATNFTIHEKVYGMVCLKREVK